MATEHDPAGAARMRAIHDELRAIKGQIRALREREDELRSEGIAMTGIKRDAITRFDEDRGRVRDPIYVRSMKLEFFYADHDDGRLTVYPQVGIIGSPLTKSGVPHGNFRWKGDCKTFRQWSWETSIEAESGRLTGCA